VIKVIHEVDLALRSLIEREATDGTEVEVVFDAPTKDWASRRNVPTIDVYLYDIREDLRRRERGLINEYDARDRITHRHLPPRHFKLSYLVTAWTQRPEDEHRLLAALLSCFLRHDAIPPDLVTGPLAEIGLPVPMTVALPPPEDRSFADVWSALGGELKPSLDVVVSAPTDTGQRYKAGPPVVKPGRISIGGVNGTWPPAEEREQMNGAATGAPEAATRGSGGAATRPASGGGRAAPKTGDPAGGGMTWREFASSARTRGSSAGSATERAAATGTAVADEDDSAKAGGGSGKAADGGDDKPSSRAKAGTDKPKPPTRRRRQGGISQQ
jgi:hypothetical protein